MCTKRSFINRPLNLSRDDPQPAAHHSSYLDVLKDCLSVCNKLHAHVCVPTPVADRNPQKRPAYLIDVVRKCVVDVEQLLKRTDATQPHRYLALSYVWPKTSAAQSLYLEKSTLDLFTTPGFLQDLKVHHRVPAAIQHAISVTSKLRERYLWVDRFCIIQDSPNLDLQISHMDGIYGDAYLTIVAASSQTLVETYVDAVRWPLVRKSPSDWLSPSYVQWRRSELHVALEASKWSRRGWTYQEQILSRRSAIFTDKGLFWDCQCGIWDGVNLKINDMETHVLVSNKRQSLVKWWPDFETYIDIVCLYNGREFTHPEDGLRGISATLRTLSPAFPGGFISGLPTIFLDDALLWQPYQCAKRRTNVGQEKTSTNSPKRLPSWSWCNWQCSIDPSSLVSGLAYINDPWIQKRAASWTTQKTTVWQPSSITAQDAVEIEQCLKATVRIVSPRCSEVKTAWKKHVQSSKSDDVYYTYSDYDHPRFRWPVSLSYHGQSRTDPVPLLLSGCAGVATFSVAAIIEERYSTSPAVRGRISAFDHPKFRSYEANEKSIDGQVPDQEEVGVESKTCPVLVLRQRSGRFAGLLRMMNRSRPLGGSLTLVAISAGSVMAKDMEARFEYKIYRSRKPRAKQKYDAVIQYPGGQSALGCELVNVFEDAGVHRSGTTPMESTRPRFMTPEDESPQPTKPKASKTPDDFRCEFYNVLWVDELDGVYYRRACGWIPKRIWEANATKRGVTLG